MDIVSYLLGKKASGGDIDWSSIGYNDTPESIINGYNYAKDIYDNYDETTTQIGNKYNHDNNLLIFPLVNTINLINASNFFDSDKNLIEIPLLNTENVTNMQSMFKSCQALKTIPLLNTGKVTNMSQMFYGCSVLTTIPLLNTENVTNMDSMFHECTNLSTIPLINTGKVTTMTQMFRNCTSLTSIPLLDTSKVTRVDRMFQSCSNLKDVPQFDFSSVNYSSGFQLMYSAGIASLTDNSINNIMLSCISATSYTGTKTLNHMGFTSQLIPASRIQALPAYQDFINAGWTIGY